MLHGLAGDATAVHSIGNTHPQLHELDVFRDARIRTGIPITYVKYVFWYSPLLGYPGRKAKGGVLLQTTKRAI